MLMRTWDTFGAFGDNVVELSWFDIWKLITGRELVVPYKCIVICLGKSQRKALGAAESREQQLSK
jgi:hypothetical protein